MKRERWWLNLPAVWNAAPARSLVSIALSNGNIPKVDTAYNTALDDEKQINHRQWGYPGSPPT
jgi:hypothetical protein